MAERTTAVSETLQRMRTAAAASRPAPTAPVPKFRRGTVATGDRPGRRKGTSHRFTVDVELEMRTFIREWCLERDVNASAAFRALWRLIEADATLGMRIVTDIRAHEELP